MNKLRVIILDSRLLTVINGYLSSSVKPNGYADFKCQKQQNIVKNGQNLPSILSSE